MNIHQHLSIRALHNMQHDTRAEIKRLEIDEIVHKKPADDVRLHNLRQTDTEIANAITWLKRLPASIAVALLLLCMPLMGAEEGALPEDVQELMVRYQEDLDEAKADYDEAVADATESVIKKLDRELKKQTRRGELAAATAIQEQIGKLQETLMLNKDPADTGYAHVVTDMPTADFSLKGLVYDNRDYLWAEVPDYGQPVKITMQSCRAPRAVSFTVKHEGVVLCASASSPGPGWEATGERAMIPGLPVDVYQQVLKEGAYSLPVTHNICGTFLIIPSKSR